MISATRHGSLARLSDQIPSGAELRAKADQLRVATEDAASRKAADATWRATENHAQLVALANAALEALGDAGCEPRLFRRSPRQHWRIDQWEIESVTGYPLAFLTQDCRELLNYYDFEERQPTFYDGQIASSRVGYPDVCPVVVASPPQTKLVRVREWQERERKGWRPREGFLIWKEAQKPEELTETGLFCYRIDGGPTALDTWRIDPWTTEDSGRLENLRESLISQAVHSYLGLKPPLARH